MSGELAASVLHVRGGVTAPAAATANDGAARPTHVLLYLDTRTFINTQGEQLVREKRVLAQRANSYRAAERRGATERGCAGPRAAQGRATAAPAHLLGASLCARASLWGRASACVDAPLGSVCLWKLRHGLKSYHSP